MTSLLRKLSLLGIVLSLVACTELKPGTDRADGAAPPVDANTDGGVDSGPIDAGPPCPDLGERMTVMIDADMNGEHIIDENTTWSCANTYVVAANVFVIGGVTLTVEAGTVVRVQTDRFILVDRTSRLVADGLADRTIVFTADADSGRGAGDWRGILLLGDAATNTSTSAKPADSVSETDNRGNFGGGPTTTSESDCGTLRYVRIEFAGGNAGENEEPGSALTLAGCGRNTIIDYVHVHKPTDGVGLYGGTVTLKHVAVTQTNAEAFQWVYGYRGVMQFIIAQTTGNGKGFLGNNQGGNFNAMPRSRPIVYNATLTSVMNAFSGIDNGGIVLATGSGLVMRNSIVNRYAGYAVDITSPGYTTFPGDELAISSTSFNGNGYAMAIGNLPGDGEATGDDDGFNERDYFLAGGLQNNEQNPQLGNADSLPMPVFVPMNFGVVQGNLAPPGDGVESLLARQTDSDFRGAMRPSTMPTGSEDWLSSWTEFPQD